MVDSKFMVLANEQQNFNQPMSAKRNQPPNPANYPGDRPDPFASGAPGPMPFSPSQKQSPVPGELDSVLDHWADDRISIFSSLDAAMTRHILDAVAALGELKRRAEEDARQSATDLVKERTALVREIGELRIQRDQFKEELQQARRELDEERIRFLGVKREAEVLGVSSGAADNGKLASEMAAMSRQIQELSRQVQELLAGKATAAPVFHPFTEQIFGANKTPPPPVNLVQPVVPWEMESQTPPSRGRNSGATELIRVPVPSDPNLERMMHMTLQEFSDAPTPKLKSNGRGKPRTGAETASSPNFGQGNTGIIESLLSSQRDPEESDIINLFGPRPTPPQPPQPMQPFSAQAEPEAKPKPATNKQTTEAEQHLQRLLNKRAFGQGQKPPKSPQISGGEAADSSHSSDDPEIRRRQAEKAAIADIGAMLGLDVNTPPPANAIRLGPGFTPPYPFELVRPNMIPPEEFNAPLPEEDGSVEAAPLIGDLPEEELQWREATLGDSTPTPVPNQPKHPESGVFPIFPLHPPVGPASEQNGEDDIETKITISNLQGLSLLMMEKVVRGLPGVRHVTVTDFRKGELVMDVRHQAALELGKVLPSLPELKLKLVGQDEGLHFYQER